MNIIRNLGFISIFSSAFFINSSYALSSQDVGIVAGGVVGGVVGSQVFHGSGKVPGIIGGAIVGAFVGGAIGKSMDKNDRRTTQNAMVTTPVGQEKTWVNRKTGDRYTVRPIRIYTNAKGQPCRVMQTTVVYANGYSETENTTLCKRGGKWYVVGN